ncbi:hypothetical protein CH379_009300 [Leptospira ellisii]|uniref:Uncharacterized protein n=1 Tax=Leptospira ellisii TaxID=2023197 RepID=A0A2N0BM10_9LEPT|nr:hypothetical protein [Leptospira ellisii]MDV6235821.1 hypothetical protein [Leptospira ellisii]PJZ93697.1 hypothetical protein CH379_06520 [Leptospira ellisii]PKA05031.1 hypothetical protein CH375_07480 [Leptospira ellisii]
MNFEDIQSAMDLMSFEILKPEPAIPMYLADHDSEVSEFPYGVYKIQEFTQDLWKNSAKKIEPNDPESFTETLRKNQRISIRVFFMHDVSVSESWMLSEKAMDWLDSPEGMNACETFGFTPSLVSGTALDETEKTSEGIYRYKTGFDVLFKSRKSIEKQGESTASAPAVEYQEEA